MMRIIKTIFFTLLLSFLQPILAIAQTGTTVFTIGNTPLWTGQAAGGINWNDQNNYSSRQISRQLVNNNRNFQGSQQSTIMMCDTLSGKTCTTDGGSFWPLGFIPTDGSWTITNLTGSTALHTATVTGYVPPTNSPVANMQITGDSTWDIQQGAYFVIRGERKSSFACSITPGLSYASGIFNTPTVLNHGQNGAYAYLDGDQSLTKYTVANIGYIIETGSGGWNCADSTPAHSSAPAYDPTVTYAAGTVVTWNSLHLQSLQSGNLNHMPKPAILECEIVNTCGQTDPWWVEVDTLYSQSTDVPPGSTARMSLLQDSSATTSTNGNFNQVFDNSGPFITMNGTYTLSYTLKIISGNPANIFCAAQRAGSGSTGGFNSGIALTPLAGGYTTAKIGTWQTVSFQLTGAETAATVGSGKFNCNNIGAKVLWGSVSFGETPTAANPTNFRNSFIKEMQYMGYKRARWMDNGTPSWGCNMLNLLADAPSRERCMYNPRVLYDYITPMSIPDFLDALEFLNMDGPFLTVPTSTSPSELILLMQFMTGAASTPGGALRVAHGHPAIYNFSKYTIELGNEVWNTANPGQLMFNSYAPGIPGTDYGTWTGTVFKAAKADTTAYDPTKYEFAASGFMAAPNWNRPVAQSAGCYADTITSAFYSGFYVNNITPAVEWPTQYQVPLMMVSSTSTHKNLNGTANPTNYLYLRQQDNQNSNPNCSYKLAFYEGNWSPGAYSPSATGLTNQGFALRTTGLGAGINQFNLEMLIRQKFGTSNMQTFAVDAGAADEYTCDEPTCTGTQTHQSGGSGVNAAGLYYWGTHVSFEGVSGLLIRPTGYADMMVNKVVRPHMMTVTASGSNPTYLPPNYNDAEPTITTPVLYGYAFSSDNTAATSTFAIVNTDTVNTQQFQLAGPLALSGYYTRTTLLSTASTPTPIDQNETTTVVKAQTDTVQMSPATIYTIAPNQVMTFTPTATPSPTGNTSLNHVMLNAIVH